MAQTQHSALYPANAPAPDGGRAARIRFMRTEIAIGIVINMVMAGVATWFLSDPALVSTGRFADAYSDIVKATAGAIVGVVIPVTLNVRGRVKRGRVARLAGAPLRPRNILLRAALLAAAASILLGVPTALLLAALAPQGAAFLAFKIAYGATIAVVVLPYVLVAALRDR